MSGDATLTGLRDALAHHQAGRLAAAFDGYQSVLRDAPRHPDALSLAGICALHMGRLEAARVLLEDAAGTGAAGPDAVCALGAIYQRKGEATRAAQICEAALARAPGHAGLLAVLGSSLLDLDRVDEAHPMLEASVQAAPDDADVQHALGVALRRLRRPADALAAFDRALKLRATFPEAYFNRGNALKDLGRMREAALAFATAGAQAPDDLDVQRRLGVAFRQMGRFDEAERVLENLVQKQPDAAPGWYQLGMVRVRRGNALGAIDALGHAVVADPEHGSARHMLSALKGETTEAAPVDHVRRVFDDYADTFESHVVERLGYDVPERMRAAVDDVLARRAEGSGPFEAALDLGCGTGLVAERFADLAGAIDGIDVSPNMIRCARVSGRYRTLIEGELTAALQSDAPAAHYGLVLAGDVFVLIGNLAPVLSAVSRRQKTGDLLVFSVETLEPDEATAEQPAYRLRADGHYAHADEALRRLAAASGYHVLAAVAVAAHRPVATGGCIYVLERDAG